MKIAISCEGANPRDSLSPVFARCECFQIYDSISGEVETHANTMRDQEHGVGPKVAQWLVDMGVEVLVTAKVGPQAQKVLDAAGMKVELRNGGSARELYESLRIGLKS